MIRNRKERCVLNNGVEMPWLGLNEMLVGEEVKRYGLPGREPFITIRL
ncbi:hypothetical protein ACE3NQ_12720 [Paenibacillus terreus]|uniref:Uncharacterized protein n=1 Tax=Paenibacillus terreus TaxID=1387834 RepID=A0ABV5B8E7_9BACL